MTPKKVKSVRKTKTVKPGIDLKVRSVKEVRQPKTPKKTNSSYKKKV